MIVAAVPLASAEITAPPTLDISTGAVGSMVLVTGAAGTASPFSTVTAYWDALSGKVLNSTSASSTGSYSMYVIVPASVNGLHYIVVNDGETESEGAPFTVTGQLIIDTIPPTLGTPKALPGDQLTVQGHGFAANSEITLVFNSTGLSPAYGFAITTPVITTNGTGSFYATITIPASLTVDEFDLYDATAEDEDTNQAVTQVSIDYYILCVPGAGPTGITTTISGRIAANMAYAIRFNGAQIDAGTTESDGSYVTAYTIPGVLSTGSYTVDIVWQTVNTRDTTFTVNPSPTIALGAANGVAGNTVTITGSGFSAAANITLYFGTTAVNSTDVDENFAKTTVAGALAAGLTFDVPALTPGIYSVTVTDQYGATSSVVYFTISPTPVFMVETRGTEYMRMDFMSLKSLSTSRRSVVIQFVDPNGLVWFKEDVASDEWQAIAGAYQIPYDNTSLTWWPIPSDAPLGTWNFTCWDAAMTKILDTNLFTVIAKPTQQDVLDKLDECCDTIEDVITTSEGKIIAAVNTKTGTIMTDIAALEPQIQGITDTVVIIATMLGEVQVAIDDIDLGSMGVDIAAIKGDVATIKTNIGQVDVAVDSLDAVLGAVAGQCAEVQTTLGTLEGKIDSIQGNTATVITDVGAIQADITDVSGKVDMTPIWIAVVLSLVAAIAAIFAVITIRQKIAG
jgi:hypothetical protein